MTFIIVEESFFNDPKRKFAILSQSYHNTAKVMYSMSLQDKSVGTFSISLTLALFALEVYLKLYIQSLFEDNHLNYSFEKTHSIESLIEEISKRADCRNFNIRLYAKYCSTAKDLNRTPKNKKELFVVINKYSNYFTNSKYLEIEKESEDLIFFDLCDTIYSLIVEDNYLKKSNTNK